MTILEQIIIISVAALATMAMRFLPFVFLKSSKPASPFLAYIGKALPPAVFGMLVIYCLKGVSILSYPFALPEFIGVLIVALLHLTFRKTLLSIAGGTLVYMLLVNVIFV